MDDGDGLSSGVAVVLTSVADMVVSRKAKIGSKIWGFSIVFGENLGFIGWMLPPWIWVVWIFGREKGGILT